jgi:hypothetical protein
MTEAYPPESSGSISEPTTTTDTEQAPRARRTRADHFREEAEKRTNRILSEIEKLSRLSNTSANEYSTEQVEAMFAAIFERVQQTAKKFDHSKGPAFEMPDLKGRVDMPF